ncbi:MAG: sigma-70 family RNA polymerase sigma factor [Planctomycetota bacterium]|jgi:RNA polymerase sigma factor (sigma-70 family)
MQNSTTKTNNNLTMESILREHYNLVHWTVSRMRIPPGSYDDMVQEAVLGLTRRLEQFDENRGRLEAWIVATSRHSVLDAMRSQGGGPIRVSRHLIRRYREEGKELGEVCSSLDERLENGESQGYTPVHTQDRMPHTDLVEKRDMLEHARRLIPTRHREVLDMLYPLDGRLPTPMREVGQRLGISESRVSQLRKEALLSMRSTLGVTGKLPRYARAG